MVSAEIALTVLVTASVAVLLAISFWHREKKRREIAEKDCAHHAALQEKAEGEKGALRGEIEQLRTAVHDGIVASAAAAAEIAGLQVQTDNLRKRIEEEADAREAAKKRIAELLDKVGVLEKHASEEVTARQLAPRFGPAVFRGCPFIDELILLRIAHTYDDAKYCLYRFVPKATQLTPPYDEYARRELAEFALKPLGYTREERKDLYRKALEAYWGVIGGFNPDGESFKLAIDDTKRFFESPDLRSQAARTIFPLLLKMKPHDSELVRAYTDLLTHPDQDVVAAALTNLATNLKEVPVQKIVDLLLAGRERALGSQDLRGQYKAAVECLHHWKPKAEEPILLRLATKIADHIRLSEPDILNPARYDEYMELAQMIVSVHSCYKPREMRPRTRHVVPEEGPTVEATLTVLDLEGKAEIAIKNLSSVFLDGHSKIWAAGAWGAGNAPWPESKEWRPGTVVFKILPELELDCELNGPVNNYQGATFRFTLPRISLRDAGRLAALVNDFALTR